MVDLINKQVIHEKFGKGNVVNHDESYIKINFKSGNKRFVFPDAFKKFLKLSDKRLAHIIKNKIEKSEVIREKEELKEQKKRALRYERRLLEQRKRQMNNSDTFTRSQSVFWVKPEENVFEDWKVFSGAIKSGQKKGQPRRLARIDYNSACLLTTRDMDEKEKERKILGVFMVDQGFNAKKISDGYIPAHSKYRIQLSNEEVEKMLFWNYYRDNAHPERIVWRSGRHRYFDNIWMAQILRDILKLREGTEKEKDIKNFYEYFCQINGIDKEVVIEPNGGLKHIIE